MSIWCLGQGQLIRKLTQAAEEVQLCRDWAKAAQKESNKKEGFRARFNGVGKYFDRFEALVDDLYDYNDELDEVEASSFGDEASGGGDPKKSKAPPIKHTRFPDAAQKTLTSNTTTYYVECQVIARAILREPEAPQSVAKLLAHLHFLN